MRRFSSEGSLLDLDFLPWKRDALTNPHNEKNQAPNTYTSNVEEGKVNGRSPVLIPIIQEHTLSGGEVEKNEMIKGHSTSVKNLSEQETLDKSHLGVCVISECCRAYSDSQLAPNTQGSSENMERDSQLTPSPSSSSSPFSFKSQHRHHKPKLPAAKLHLKSLFGQSPQSSNSSQFNAEEKNSAIERRSRLHFMHQWSQVGHSKKRKISREELVKWAESLNALLASQTGLSVFEAFLRSEFSEENLQFYLACEQYRHSSNNFSLQRRAKDICATYIQPGAPREVNLDAKTRDLTMQLLQAPSHTSLSHAQKRIYSLLDIDCYPRFLQSNIYLSLLREAD
uniref:RGS domain-containing protein n=1 Tax=Monopterus albus TaxID=43700 RepID=A0A3Q3K4X7_MONAL|nr:regulator of G-protein signaling 1-like [Monopterus albus]XP_020480489.1 regulator of G-protein signaling 1-like [Monopterus albus]XP_020480490.1 regulator of G-protein signaling 1-like [Monopterus albus]XP_020480491.1 regulator of G-protein signaling 1-like [Monopterus albus]XP_020480493.1 regulator of G-protein signaling 1-like [Monopterus albus]XP_020480494.1 regulator of G-protein signaling 1-like [Monopterus albus]